MLKIFVCEDNKVQMMRIKDIVENTIIRENLDMSIVTATNDPQEILNFLKNDTKTVGIYFLDIDLRCSLNGIKLAEEIRKIDREGFIIFITTHIEMSFLTFEYKVEAMDYIIKDDYIKIKNRINDCLLEANKRFNENQIYKESKSLFTFKNNEKIINVKFDNILFFETSSTVHKVRIHEVNRQIEFYGNLKDIESELDERFCRCHKSFIVNKDNIKEIDTFNRIIYMINEEICLVSVRELRKLLKEKNKEYKLYKV